METIQNLLAYIDQHQLYPDIRVVESAPHPEVRIDGRNYLMFCTNNYLNLATHPAVIAAAQKATAEFGTGAGGSRLISGSTSLHEQLEQTIAHFKEREDSLVFSSGYLTNIGVIAAVANPLSAVIKGAPSAFLSAAGAETVIIGDELNHASIIDACRIARVQHVAYHHGNMSDLERKLDKFRDNRKIIVTDGVFSMDGDLAPLPEIVALAKKFDAITIVDDAHGTGILGKSGKGITSHFGLQGEVDIEIGTLNKVFAGVGGYAAASATMCRFLRIAARPYIFSAAMPPAVAAGLITAIRIAQTDDSLREKLQRNIHYLTFCLHEAGIPAAENSTPVIPVIVGKEETAVSIAQELFDAGFFVPAIRWPAVPKGKARLRVTLMAEHTEEQIREFTRALSRLFHKHGLLKQQSSLAA